MDAHAVREELCATGVVRVADLRNGDDAPAAIGLARNVHDEIDGGVHLIADGIERELHIAEQHHRLDSAKRVGGTVRVARRQ